MTILLMLPLLFGNFVQKWYFPQGIDWGAGRIIIGDTDRDGNWEFIFSTYGGQYTIYFYELHLPDTWMMDSVPNLNQPLLWDIGDFDSDGSYDLVMQSSWGPPSVGIAIFESPNPFSYPTQEVWRDTVGQPAVVPICVYDVDKDMLPEIIDNNGNGQPHWIWVYESTGNNQYDTVCTFNPMVDTFGYGINSTYAFGDFDGDSSIEFVAGDLSGYYWVFESPSNNTYEQVHQGQLPTYNIRDCFSVPDADGDGKLEFVVKGYVIPSAQIHAFIFEATGDNTYEIIKTFTLYGGDYYGGYSDIGDVDGDSVPEIALEGRQTVHIIKAAGNDSFYVWETLPGNSSGSSVRVFDVDGNGLSEVIISGNDQTRIYEYEVGIAETSGSAAQQIKLEISPNPFREQTMIRCSILDSGCWMPRATVMIYDASGRLVKSLDPGSSITWCGDDDSGRQVPQGVYFLRVDNPDSGDIINQKVIRVK